MHDESGSNQKEDNQEIGKREDQTVPAPVPSVPLVPLIPQVTIPAENRQLRFSFRHLDLEHPKFRLTDCTAEFLRSLVRRIKEYSTWTVDDFCDQNNDDHRHVINFTETSEPEGFASVDTDQFAYHDSWQFELSRNYDWRVHGILVDDMFYVIWLDCGHTLYARPKVIDHLP